MSADPALPNYFDSLTANGGIFNSLNLSLYNYGHQNPLKYVDPDGNMAKEATMVAIGMAPICPECTAAILGITAAVVVGGTVISYTKDYIEKQQQINNANKNNNVDTGGNEAGKSAGEADKNTAKDISEGSNTASPSPNPEDFNNKKSDKKYSGNENLKKEYESKSNKEIEKGIKSTEKQIQKHQEKIQNPEKYFDKNTKPDIIKKQTEKWQKEIDTFKKQVDTFKEILKDRGQSE